MQCSAAEKDGRGDGPLCRNGDGHRPGDDCAHRAEDREVERAPVDRGEVQVRGDPAEERDRQDHGGGHVLREDGQRERRGRERDEPVRGGHHSDTYRY
ncbi:hypothetical protein ACFQL4_06525 [Halosimplex aquaticum]